MLGACRCRRNPSATLAEPRTCKQHVGRRCEQLARTSRAESDACRWRRQAERIAGWQRAASIRSRRTLTARQHRRWNPARSRAVGRSRRRAMNRSTGSRRVAPARCSSCGIAKPGSGSRSSDCSVSRPRAYEAAKDRQRGACGLARAAQPAADAHARRAAFPRAHRARSASLSEPRTVGLATARVRANAEVALSRRGDDNARVRRRLSWSRPA